MQDEQLTFGFDEVYSIKVDEWIDEFVDFFVKRKFRYFKGSKSLIRYNNVNECFESIMKMTDGTFRLKSVFTSSDYFIAEKNKEKDSGSEQMFLSIDGLIAFLRQSDDDLDFCEIVYFSEDDRERTLENYEIEEDYE